MTEAFYFFFFFASPFLSPIERLRRRHSGKVVPAESHIQLHLLLRIDDGGRYLTRLERLGWEARPAVPNHWNALPHVSSSPALTPHFTKQLNKDQDAATTPLRFRLSASVRDEYCGINAGNKYGTSESGEADAAVDLKVFAVSLRQLSDDGLVLLALHVRPLMPDDESDVSEIGAWLFACQAARSSLARWSRRSGSPDGALQSEAVMDTRSLAASLISHLGITPAGTPVEAILPSVCVHSQIRVRDYRRELITYKTDRATFETEEIAHLEGETRELLLSTLSGQPIDSSHAGGQHAGQFNTVTLQLKSNTSFVLAGSNTHSIEWLSATAGTLSDIPDDQVLSPAILLDVWSLHIAQYAFLCDASRQIGELASNKMSFEAHVTRFSEFIAKSYFGRISTDRRVQDFYRALREGSGVEEIFQEVHQELFWLAELRESRFKKHLEMFATVLGTAGFVIGVGQVMGVEKTTSLGILWASVAFAGALGFGGILLLMRRKSSSRAVKRFDA